MFMSARNAPRYAKGRFMFVKRFDVVSNKP